MNNDAQQNKVRSAAALPPTVTDALKEIRDAADNVREVSRSETGNIFEACFALIRVIDEHDHVFPPRELPLCGCKGNLAGKHLVCPIRERQGTSLTHYVQCPACLRRTGYFDSAERAVVAWDDVVALNGTVQPDDEITLSADDVAGIMNSPELPDMPWEGDQAIPLWDRSGWIQPVTVKIDADDSSKSPPVMDPVRAAHELAERLGPHVIFDGKQMRAINEDWARARAEAKKLALETSHQPNISNSSVGSRDALTALKFRGGYAYKRDDS